MIHWRVLTAIRDMLSRVIQNTRGYLNPLGADFDRFEVQKTAAAAFLVFAIAGGARVLYLDDLSKLPPEGDLMVPTGGPYVREAERIALEGFIPEDTNERSHGARLLHPPGYSLYLLGTFKLIGWDNRLGVMALQAGLGAVTAALVFVLIAWAITLRAGILGGLLIALSPRLARTALFLSPGSLFAIPVILAVCCLYLANRRSSSIKYYIAAGLLLGMACWLRSNGLLMSPFFAFIAVSAARNRKREMKYALAMVLVTLATIAPITIRNYFISGRFIPVSIGVGADTLMRVSADALRRARGLRRVP